MPTIKRIPFPPLPFAVLGEVVRFPDQPTAGRLDADGSSSRWGDESCANESPSVDDATGYSKEEEDESTADEEVP